ncbi:MAG: SGNH/GDSL hydrolase family protein [Bacilli bacterium]|nr:SGNH/GDSL hydrolase family protein [Bacilli bacterium]
MNPIKKIRTDGGDVSIFRTIGFIGDSLSSGEHESTKEDGTKGFHDYYEYSWGQYIARKCGLTAYNFSQGGLQARTFLEDYIQKNSPFVLEKRCQAYVIALGLNDMTHIADYPDGFGSMADVDLSDYRNNKKSYVGCYVKIIQMLREFAPKCRIFVMTTAREKPESEEKKKNFDAIQSFLNSLPSVFDFLYVLDIRRYGPTYDPAFGKKYFLGGHMNALGYKFTADMVSTYMTYYINEYPEQFAQVGFLYTGLNNAHCKY